MFQWDSKRESVDPGAPLGAFVALVKLNSD